MTPKNDMDGLKTEITTKSVLRKWQIRDAVALVERREDRIILQVVGAERFNPVEEYELSAEEGASFMAEFARGEKDEPMGMHVLIDERGNVVLPGGGKPGGGPNEPPNERVRKAIVVMMKAVLQSVEAMAVLTKR